MRAPATALLLAACAGGSETPEATLCEGAGEPTLALGSGGLEGFEAWPDGADVEIEADGGGRYGFFVDLYTTGIDTTASVTTFLRYTLGDDPATEDVGATLTLQCPEEGPGWTGVFVPLDDTLQDAAAVAALDGLAMELSGSLTDQAGEVAETEVSLVVSAP